MGATTAVTIKGPRHKNVGHLRNRQDRDSWIVIGGIGFNRIELVHLQEWSRQGHKLAR